MADIVTGFIGAILFVIFLGFVLVQISDVALWVVCAVSTACMIYAFWGDAVRPALSGTNGNGRA